MKEKVILGMSGGVDSAVAAYLLQKEGYEVIAVHFSVHNTEATQKELQDCQKIADKFSLTLYSYSLEKEFQEKIISYYLTETGKGKTPSPCPLCDDSIKFHLLFQEAEKRKANYVATGHYASVSRNNICNTILLEVKHHIHKDQCYMLYRLSPKKLNKILFPLASLEKAEVRELARDIGLFVSEKKDSQGICFAPEGYQNFLKKHLAKKIQKGNFIDEKGNILGQHLGYPLYTLGQRRGLGIKTKEICFITKIDPGKNEITLGNFESLMKDKVQLEDTVLHLPFERLKDMELLARPRFSSTGFFGKLKEEEGELTFHYFEKNAHNTPGQHLVLFYKNYVVGGGIIR
ncbi:tRNA 2-thiouridine(34) synthase MnmA [Fusobacterium necrophorum]|uniref:tRNA-uridine 2-sulfurtransferase n=1 Tax=Fusobacterium necrophorum DJ-2 TaxID=1441737 RepID=A0AB73C377_9FUSO|nr:tRNA 2-thiouridine(34) synthase MnmA [Fusobacterium necrophorum]KDE68520.1 thiouridylase [Fusobacterium necrophorum DJ-1]KDE72059.1 thiouridylase [Fusobacterium necrophorum DJ-2]MBR8722726.1 tRNA-specific 2-thiouridylase MnmA [Fusobacterium necrophorum subsp. funduliforme]MCI7680970.1 tRNA 2-thiouridine(34) synthase MnmA [Fusobacterium necrophorum]MDK4522930.1 tRNA 2-thiouridine(34) synthase MnmA [Fusobacterium necrophorum]